MRRLLFTLALAACAPAEAPPATDATAAAPAEPWTLADVAPDTSDGLRILVLHDMEGLSGQSDPKTFNFGEKEYPKGQELLAADVNAVIEGLYAGGATEVWVVDGHGSGNPDPDVRTDLLDKRQRSGDPLDAYCAVTRRRSTIAVDRRQNQEPRPSHTLVSIVFRQRRDDHGDRAGRFVLGPPGHSRHLRVG
jgi:hypothetical protein